MVSDGVCRTSVRPGRTILKTVLTLIRARYLDGVTRAERVEVERARQVLRDEARVHFPSRLDGVDHDDLSDQRRESWRGGGG